MIKRSVVTLWSIQTEEAYKELQKNGVLRADPALIMDQDWHSAYQWMVNQMKTRLSDCKGDFYPLWAWHSPKPNLARAKKYIKEGKRGVILEIKVDQSRVLLSDFDSFHYVLMQEFFPYSISEWNIWNKKAKDKTGNEFYRFNELPPSLKVTVKKSWERIFNIKKCQRGQKDPYTQAVVREIFLSDVIRAKFFDGGIKKSRKLPD